MGSINDTNRRENLIFDQYCCEIETNLIDVISFRLLINAVRLFTLFEEEMTKVNT